MRSALFSVFVTVFIDLLGFGIVIPILPFYAQHYGATGWEIGWLMTSYSLMQFLVSPLWGRISDRFGRRPILLLSLVGSSVSMAMLGFADSLLMLFIARMLAGFFGASISTAYAYVTDVTTEENRAKGMGLIGAGLGLGFTLGPGIGGLLSPYGYGVPMFAGSALAAANFVLALFVLKESKKPSTQTAEKKKKPLIDLENWKVAFTHSGCSVPISIFFIFILAMTQMEVILAIFMGAAYGFDARSTGLLFCLVGFLMVIVQGGLIGRLAQRFGEKNLIIFATGSSGLALILFANIHHVQIAVVLLCVMAIGRGLAHPSLSALTSLGAPPSHRGTIMGVFHSSSSLARVIGPPVAGWLYDHVSHGTPFSTGGVLLILACTLAAASSLRKPVPI